MGSLPSMETSVVKPEKNPAWLSSQQMQSSVLTFLADSHWIVKSAGILLASLETFEGVELFMGEYSHENC